ncbi:MAG: cadherin-like domain-containing protein, partial [Pirellulaceae bacterium]|nr:cadherin-like domain-containing protein [Pirellulaceae bacterium]
LVTGTVGGSVSGQVFNDVNRDGAVGNDPGLAGVVVFADLDGDGIRDASEPSAVTDANGNFTLSAAAGTYNVIAIAPSQFSSSTPSSQSANFALGGSAAAINFGFVQVTPDITGTKWADLDNDRVFDTNEPGIGGVFIYLDLDGDDRPDIGEPSAITNPDGTYSINFPAPGTYTIREVVQPGFVQSFPVGGEHTVVFDGTAVTQNFNFGNVPSRDFGDAPDSYRTLTASVGPSHGLTAGLRLGANIDRDLDGRPTADALGDDINGRVDSVTGTVIDDEDGVILLSPLGPGGTGDLRVTVTNTTGAPAFLQAWMDFNRDGDFTDAGEQFQTNVQLATGTYTIPVSVPASAVVGTTYARFRYSQTSGLGVGGAADTGEVEDYSFQILAEAEIANADEFNVSRNSLSNQLAVLANDFQTADNQLIVESVTRIGTVNGEVLNTAGTLVISQDRKSVFYTPPNGFIGLDKFAYTVVDEFDRRSTTIVTVNVTFQSDRPIALDDTFEVPEGSVGRALNVLDNDVASLAGGLSITSVTPGNRGGTIAILGGGQSLRYTPLPGFNGTEQFTYSIQDSAGVTSTAQVTINLLPGSRNDDVVNFTVEVLDSTNNLPIDNIAAGRPFEVRVYVDQVGGLTGSQVGGVASAFVDLLYTDELVATRKTDLTSSFPFDITFGPLFAGMLVNEFNNDPADPNDPFQQGDGQVPGLINEVGGIQTTIPGRTHADRAELFTISMQALSPGVAVFQTDPADNVVSETAVIGANEALLVNELGFGKTELVIFPSSTNFTSAIDDSFGDGKDSNGVAIGTVSSSRLNVLANDNLGTTGTITERGIGLAPRMGRAAFNDNGTPSNLNDDYVEFFPDGNASGFDQFTYLIVTADGVRSTATVTMAIGNGATLDDRVAIDFNLVDTAGNSISSISVGQTFGVQVLVDDLTDNTFVFAAYLDLLYDSGIITPSNTTTFTPGVDPCDFTADNFRFDVCFTSDFDTTTAVGTAIRPGVIDEFGTLLRTSVAQSQQVSDPNLMATVYFDAISTGSLRIAGGPADRQPFQDTLLYLVNDPIPVSQIRYDVINITVTGPQAEYVQNTERPTDVNNDGDTSPLDALLVLNRLADEALAQGDAPLSSNMFLDVNGNGELSPSDALAVLNELVNMAEAKTTQVQAELIQSATLANSDSGQPGDNAASDDVFATLNEQPLVDSGSPQGNAIAVTAIDISSSDANDDDEDDDLLNLLADDQSGL